MLLCSHRATTQVVVTRSPRRESQRPFRLYLAETSVCGFIFMRSVMSCEASYLLLRTPARETLLSTVLSADRLRRAGWRASSGWRGMRWWQKDFAAADAADFK